ncbi:hypothetical protein [Actinomadura madurae]|uniref:Uncharacterized protein n=1 Tax=Actinomadura madurae TaxID=1993 RepID=A0A1I4XXK0_9ACTN|nr:hypothetical protein [Actinomadura madurae]SFN30466.1 hypothetical protein SAMN04489713_1011075 [Actinomadura madurae]SPT63693.1 Uncharacterised protein [Actinomadura madurae]
MATRAAIAGMTAAAMATLGLAAGFAHAQNSHPPRLGDTVQVSPPPASRGRAPAASRPARAPAGPAGPADPARSARPAPRQDVRAAPSPVPPASDDDDEVEVEADDRDADD